MRYQYNNKELNPELTLNWYDYGARFYDPAIARWGSVDPLAESYYSYSPYNYVLGNPILFVDPDGKRVGDPPTKTKRTTIYNTFKYNDNCRNCGTDIITEQHTVVTVQRRDKDGVELYRKTDLTTTNAEIDANGNITNISKSTLSTVITNGLDGGVTQYSEEEDNISLEETSKNFQDVVNMSKDFKKENGISLVQQEATLNESRADIAELVSGAATVSGAVISFIPHPYAQTTGKVVSGIGVAALGVSSTAETNPEKIKLNYSK
ncbi:MAG: RHS repeat-associated core domain-containing protein [Chitinophagales bacterium]|nr:hypothetical protein [Chitinophagales bacterium]